MLKERYRLRQQQLAFITLNEPRDGQIIVMRWGGILGSLVCKNSCWQPAQIFSWQLHSPLNQSEQNILSTRKSSVISPSGEINIRKCKHWQMIGYAECLLMLLHKLFALYNSYSTDIVYLQIPGDKMKALK